MLLPSMTSFTSRTSRVSPIGEGPGDVIVHTQGETFVSKYDPELDELSVVFDRDIKIHM
jgi:hypothetical protein